MLRSTRKLVSRPLLRCTTALRPLRRQFSAMQPLAWSEEERNQIQAGKRVLISLLFQASRFCMAAQDQVKSERKEVVKDLVRDLRVQVDCCVRRRCSRHSCFKLRSQHLQSLFPWASATVGMPTPTHLPLGWHYAFCRKPIAYDRLGEDGHERPG